MVGNQNLYFLSAIAIFVTALVAIAAYHFLLARRSSQASWQELVAKLTRIDGNVIAEVALDKVDSGEHPGSGRVGAGGLEPAQLWDMLGGLQGLEALETNSKILIELACYIQRSYPEALPIAEQLRLDSRALQWHVSRLRGAVDTGNLEVSFPFYAQRAVATYYVMTQRLLALYEATNFDLLPRLQSAL